MSNKSTRAFLNVSSNMIQCQDFVSQGLRTFFPPPPPPAFATSTNFHHSCIFISEFSGVVFWRCLHQFLLVCIVAWVSSLLFYRVALRLSGSGIMKAPSENQVYPHHGTINNMIFGRILPVQNDLRTNPILEARQLEREQRCKMQGGLIRSFEALDRLPISARS